MSLSKKAWELIDYLGFKMECAAGQEELGWRVDLDKATGCRDQLLKIRDQKHRELSDVMPPKVNTKKQEKPKQTHKKDGSLSVNGERWYDLLKSLKLPETTVGPVTVEVDREKGNPGSHMQIKEWLFALGWEPATYDYKKNTDGSERKIPQVRKEGELCESVLRLIDIDPAVEILDGLTVAQHRLGIFEGFIESAIQGSDGNWYLKAEIQGFTNTLRFKHKKPLVNLPGVDKPWGKEIRGCLTCPDGMSLCGADVESLESTTKRHFIMPYDPDYAHEMSQEGFDEHLDLAVKAGALTQEEYDFYVWYESNVG